MTRHVPKPLGDPVTHYWLAKSMAVAAGVDLDREMQAGRMTQDAWAGLVRRCRGCDWQRDGGGCGRWLALQLPGEAEVPEACENHDAFATLSAS